VRDLEQLREALVEYISIAVAKLRSHGLHASAMQVFISTGRYGTGPYANSAATLSLPMPSDSTPYFIRHGVAVLERLYGTGFHYRKAGVLLFGLQSACEHQQGLFDGNRAVGEREKHLMKAVDTINARWGRGTVSFALASSKQRGWRMRRRFMSRRYTTCWQELPIVKA
jgi:DNA polymerase V